MSRHTPRWRARGRPSYFARLHSRYRSGAGTKQPGTCGASTAGVMAPPVDWLTRKALPTLTRRLDPPCYCSYTATKYSGRRGPGGLQSRGRAPPLPAIP